MPADDFRSRAGGNRLAPVAESLACDRAHSFSTRLWDSIGDIYRAILAHPFITGLTDGTLPAESFAFYVVQDALYLQDYARALAAVGSRAPTSNAMQMFARHAADAVAAELELHATLLTELGISLEDVKRAEQAPTNRGYTSYLLATAHAGSYAEGVAAVLPCYWIYWEVGKELQRLGSPDPRYQRWISAYAAPEYGEVVASVIAEVDRHRADGFQRRARADAPPLHDDKQVRVDVLAGRFHP